MTPFPFFPIIYPRFQRCSLVTEQADNGELEFKPIYITKKPMRIKRMVITWIVDNGIPMAMDITSHGFSTQFDIEFEKAAHNFCSECGVISDRQHCQHSHWHLRNLTNGDPLQVVLICIGVREVIHL